MINEIWPQLSDCFQLLIFKKIWEYLDSIYFIVLEQFMTNKVSKFAWLNLSPKDDQGRGEDTINYCGEDTKISKNFLGENPTSP